MRLPRDIRITSARLEEPVDDRLQEKYERIEMTHAWSVARRDVLVRLLNRYSITPTTQVLDVGCSSGALVEELVRMGYTNLTAVDVSEKVVARCHARGLHQVQHVTGTHTKFPDSSFDCIIASDVLEHIEDDSEALREWIRLLRPGGLLIIFVPAFAFMWSEHDVLAHHHRRYTRGQLVREVRQAGFRIEEQGYWNFLLFFPTVTGRLIARTRGLLRPGRDPNAPGKQDAYVELNPIVNAFLRELMKVENRLLTRGLRYPVGVSTWAVARKPAV